MNVCSDQLTINDLNFTDKLLEIEEDLDKVESKLKYEKHFPPKARQHFSSTLDKIQTFMSKAKPYFMERSPQDYLKGSSYAVQLNKIENKLNEIKDLINLVTGKYFFFNVINKDVVPMIGNMKKEIFTRMKQERRLPFHSAQVWEHYRLKVEKELNSELQETKLAQQITSIKILQKDVFHLLANQLQTQDLDQLDTDRLEGSFELQALLSHSQILTQLLRTVEVESRRKVLNFLLNQLDRALTTALKTTYAYLTHASASKNFLDSYLKKLARINILIDSGKMDLARKAGEEFNHCYFLSLSSCHVPKTIIVNDICHDILDRMKEMAPGELQIFNLGTANHSILIQIKNHGDGTYQYTIFNTGEGTDDHTCLIDKNNNRIVKPLIIDKINANAILNYAFVETLVKFSVTPGTKTIEFYKYHMDYLIKEKGGIREDDSRSIPEQKSNTCSYSVIEAWINTYLTQEEILKKEKLKVSLVLKKQERVIEILQRKEKTPTRMGASPKISKYRSPVFSPSPRNTFLTESKQLKQLAELYRKQLISQERNFKSFE